MSQKVDLEQLVTAIGDAVVVADADGIITLWNPAAERMFGYAEAEAVGQSLDLITPERHRVRHWRGYAKTAATGKTRYGHELLRVPAIGKGDLSLSIAFTVSLLFDGAGRVTGIAAVIRDETARWNEERELRKRIAELEAAQPAAAEADLKVSPA